MKEKIMPKQTLANLELEALTELTTSQLESIVGGANAENCRMVQKIVAGVVTFVLVCGAGTGEPGGPHLPEPGHPPVPGAPPIVVTPTPRPPPAHPPSPGALRLHNPT
jgi:hypothetical protein